MLNRTSEELHFNGLGVPGLAKAAELYAQPAAAGLAEAQFALGLSWRAAWPAKKAHQHSRQ